MRLRAGAVEEVMNWRLFTPLVAKNARTKNQNQMQKTLSRVCETILGTKMQKVKSGTPENSQVALFNHFTSDNGSSFRSVCHQFSPFSSTRHP